MNRRFLVVKMAHPYGNIESHNIDSFDIFNLSKHADVCMYLAETNKYHDNLITLTPLSVYAVLFPVDSINENEFRKFVNKRTFDVSTEFFKAQGFADYVKRFINYLYMCTVAPNKYYLQFGLNTIKYKKDKYFVNGQHYCYGELINMVFKSAWEYENLKLKKYNIFKRLFS